MSRKALHHEDFCDLTRKCEAEDRNIDKLKRVPEKLQTFRTRIRSRNENRRRSLTKSECKKTIMPITIHHMCVKALYQD
ncbi:MAG TPA: hypothetical protein DCS30_05505 [Rhizobiales bacterium]|nr:hypothetical protein [Hyphomicrobiales bacterium]